VQAKRTTPRKRGQGCHAEGELSIRQRNGRCDWQNWGILRSMTFRSTASVFLALAAIVAGPAANSQCSESTQGPANRVFAKVNDHGPWREYRGIESVPDLVLDGGISAQLWDEANGSFSIRTVEPGGDFWTYTNYCFVRSGELARLSFEVRTAWGWAYRLEGPVENGAIRATTSGFSDTKTGEPVPRPGQADDVSQALKPTLYLRARQFPFSNLLATPKSGPAAPR
jgi:hypothetical protein